MEPAHSETVLVQTLTLGHRANRVLLPLTSQVTPIDWPCPKANQGSSEHHDSAHTFCHTHHGSPSPVGTDSVPLEYFFLASARSAGPAVPFTTLLEVGPSLVAVFTPQPRSLSTSYSSHRCATSRFLASISPFRFLATVDRP